MDWPPGKNCSSSSQINENGYTKRLREKLNENNKMAQILHTQKPKTELKQFRNTNYFAGSDGNIYRKTAKGYRELRGRRVSGGYLGYALYDGKGNRQQIYGHHIILETFYNLPYSIMRQHKLEALHQNHIKTDNRPDNLKVGTRSMNMRDNQWRKEAHRNSNNRLEKWNDEKIKEIRKLLDSGYSIYRVVKEYEVAYVTVWRIKNNVGRYAVIGD